MLNEAPWHSVSSHRVLDMTCLERHAWLEVRDSWQLAHDMFSIENLPAEAKPHEMLYEARNMGLVQRSPQERGTVGWSFPECPSPIIYANLHTLFIAAARPHPELSALCGSAKSQLASQMQNTWIGLGCFWKSLCISLEPFTCSTWPFHAFFGGAG